MNDMCGIDSLSRPFRAHVARYIFPSTPMSRPFRAGDGRIRSRPRALPWATMSRPFRAHDGDGFPFPRALPWATMSRPFRAHVARYILPNTPMSRPFRAHVARYIFPSTPMSRPFRAGDGRIRSRPRALPWALMCWPFRPKSASIPGMAGQWRVTMCWSFRPKPMSTWRMAGRCFGNMVDGSEERPKRARPHSARQMRTWRKASKRGDGQRDVSR